MVIVLALAPAKCGGLEHVVSGLASGLQARCHRVLVAAIVSERAHPFVRELEGSDVAAHPIVLPARAYHQEREAMRRLCRAVRPDVVHTHGYRSDVLDGEVARTEGVPVVTTVHGFTRGDWKNRFYEWLQRRSWGGYDAVVAVSRPLADQIASEGIPRDRIHLVQNAWLPGPPPLDRAAARATLGIPDNRFVAGWVGRLSHEKGPDVFLDALAALVDLPVHGVLVGEGRDREALARRVARLELQQRVTWPGAVPRAARLFRAFDCFVLSSRTEGTPIGLLEAMAAGTPIVATAVGGVPHVVGTSEALLVPPEDPGTLARRIREALVSPDAARVRAAAARARLDRDFAAGPWVARYEAIYRAATHRRTGRGKA